MTCVLTTQFNDLPVFRKGKVRDVYDLNDQLLVIATDRISAFDAVMPNGIPEKGKMLTQLSLFWFNLTQSIVQNHLITTNILEYPSILQKYAPILNGRSMLVKKAKLIPIECIVRGYLSGSGWKEYQKTQSVCGIALPAGLKESDKLPTPIFTPSTKEDEGHDQNISFKSAANLIGLELAEKIQKISLALYSTASQYAEQKGIIIADTKFEFGIYQNDIILIDEVLTPDSSRFWPKELYEPGKSQPSFDKQFVRDYLETLSWDKTPPAPALPNSIIEKTQEKYKQAYEQLTGKKFV